MSATGLGTRICLWWTRWYTRRLSDDVAGSRHGEIISDLWEHEQDSAKSGQSRTRFNLSVIRRTLAGVPADLAWRRGMCHAHARPVGDLDPFGRPVDKLLIVVASLGVFPATALIPLLLTERLSGAQIVLLVAPALLAIVLVVGLVLRARDTRPVTSTVLLVVGSPAPSLAVFWLPPVYLLSLAIAVTAVASMPRRPARSMPARS